MTNSFLSFLNEPDRALTTPEAVYSQGVAHIMSQLQESVSSALEDHRQLLSSVLALRLAAPLVEEGRLRVNVPGASATPGGRSAPTASSSRRTARELVLDALAMASEPISFADVKLAVVAAGGSELGAHKVRTDLLKKGAIVNRRGLYTLTETGQEMRAAYG